MDVAETLDWMETVIEKVNEALGDDETLVGLVEAGAAEPRRLVQLAMDCEMAAKSIHCLTSAAYFQAGINAGREKAEG